MGRGLAIIVVLVVLGVVIENLGKKDSGQSFTSAQPADDAQARRRIENFDTKTLGEQTIRSTLKDPDSGVFTESEGRLKDGKHIACGYVNAKNSFGAMAGTSPWLVIVETKTAMIETEQNQGKFSPLWNKYCAAPQDSVRSQRAPPDAFRGIKWDSALPSTQKLRDTVLQSCAAIVEQKNFTDTPPCSHMHMDTDEMELFSQRRNVPPIFGVAVNEQLLTWSHRKFWSGQVFILDYSDSELAKLQAALKDQYGNPTFTNDGLHLAKWQWPDKKIEIQLSFNPSPKPSVGSDKTPHSSMNLFFERTE
jgi:hypothetical protein